MAERLIALRYLRARKQDGFVSLITALSFIGIALGVATLIVVMAVMNGFRAELVKSILGVNGHLSIASYGRDLAEYDDIIKHVQAVPLVQRVVPIVESQLMITTAARARGVVMRGVPLEALQALKPLADNMKQGKLEHLQQPNTVILGQRLADGLGVGVGEKISLLSPRGQATPFGTAPRVRSYVVAGIFNMGMSLYDDSFVFMSLQNAQAFTDRTATGIEIFVQNPDATDKLLPPVRAAIDPDPNQRPYALTTWQQANDTFLSALAIERNVMFLILSLIVLVASLNIVSSMTMLVKDKTTDIAVMRTMGASRGMVLRVFMMAGAAIGIVGTSVGLVAGLLFCANIETVRQVISRLLGVSLFDPKVYFLSKMPAQVIVSDVVAVAGMAFVLSVLAALYPALRASRLQPAEALRYG